MDAIDPMLLMAFRVFGGLVGIALGLVTCSVLSAWLLQLATRLLGLGKISYRIAFKGALLSQFVVLMLNFSVSINLLMLLRMNSNNQRGGPYVGFDGLTYIMTSSSGLYMILFLGLSLLSTATIFSRVIPQSPDKDKLTLSDSFALACLFFALVLASMIAVAIFVFCIVGGIVNLSNTGF